jgi:transcriptional regulator with XRE-family HTH domain
MRTVKVNSPMSETAIGETLHRLRLGRGLSLRTLAARAGFSPSFLSQVENGQSSPSIASLERLARALGLRLVDFFEQATGEPAVVLRAAERRRLTSEWSRARIESLLPQGALAGLEGLVVTLAPGGRSGKATVQGSEQLAVVLQGAVALTLSGRDHLLETGDAAGIPVGCPYAWENSGDTGARLVIISRR